MSSAPAGSFARTIALGALWCSPCLVLFIISVHALSTTPFQRQRHRITYFHSLDHWNANFIRRTHLRVIWYDEYMWTTSRASDWFKGRVSLQPRAILFPVCAGGLVRDHGTQFWTGRTNLAVVKMQRSIASAIVREFVSESNVRISALVLGVNHTYSRCGSADKVDWLRRGSVEWCCAGLVLYRVCAQARGLYHN